MSPDPAKVSTARQILKGPAGPSGFGSATDEERILKAADAGTTYAGWTGHTGTTGRTGAAGATGATGPTGP